MRAILFISLHCWLIDLLAQLENDEFGGLERCETDQDVDYAVINILLCCGGAIALDEKGVIRLATLESSSTELCQHKRANVQPQAGPERLVIGFEDGPLDAVVDADTQEDRHTPYGNIA